MFYTSTLNPYAAGPASQAQFTRANVPVSMFRPSAVPMAASGTGPLTSIINVMARVASPAGPTSFNQNYAARTPKGWASNPFSGRNAVLTGNGFSGGQV